jgi:hypothetical protein
VPKIYRGVLDTYIGCLSFFFLYCSRKCILLMKINEGKEATFLTYFDYCGEDVKSGYCF